jgi:hypothetical protein
MIRKSKRIQKRRKMMKIFQRRNMKTIKKLRARKRKRKRRRKTAVQISRSRISSSHQMVEALNGKTSL